MELAKHAYEIAPSPQRADTLGWSLVANGEFSQGLIYLRRAGATQPQNPAVQYHLGRRSQCFRTER